MLFDRRFFDFAVIKIVDDNRRSAERTAHTVIIRHIIKSDFRSILFQLCVQPLPIAAVVSVSKYLDTAAGEQDSSLCIYSIMTAL